MAVKIDFILTYPLLTVPHKCHAIAIPIGFISWLGLLRVREDENLFD